MKVYQLVIFVLIGYCVAMLIKYFLPKTKHKVTFIGVVGSVITAKSYPRLSTALAGAALYDLGEQAGLTFLSEEQRTLGKIKQVLKVETIKTEGQTFKVKMSEWFFPYFVEKDKKRKTTLYQFLTKNPNFEKGLYFIRDSDTRDYIYIGMAASDTRGLYERVYRHFQAATEGFNNMPYEAGENGDNYQIRIVTINNPTKERLEAVERYYHNTLNPADSRPQSVKAEKEEEDVVDIEYEEVEVPF